MIILIKIRIIFISKIQSMSILGYTFGYTSVDEWSVETILERIENVIMDAAAYDGKVFGGYVRDVIVPRMKTPSCNVSFKDVDIWFRSQNCADVFIRQMQTKCRFTIDQNASIKPGTLNHTFGRYQYQMNHHGYIIWFDIVVSDCFPVDDFDVNCLIYHYINGKAVINSKHNTCDTNTLTH